MSIFCRPPLKDKNHSEIPVDRIVLKFVCNDCGAIFYKSFCNECHNVLFKNGFLWTYNDIYEDERYNIICPNCDTHI